MAFCLGQGIWGSVFAVPSAVTDQHLKIASGLSVKVLLLLLRREGNVEPEEMASLLGQSVADIQDALNYWVQSGILLQGEAPQEDASPPEALPQEEAPPVLQYHRAPDPPEPSSDNRKIATLGTGRSRLTTQMINELAAQDETIQFLLQESQSVLGKPLTPVATDTIVALYSYHGMQPDLILMLLHYCVSIGKENMRYIEKVAADWLERGIDSHEKAEEEILRLTRKDTAEGKVKAAFGIYDRSLVASEKKYIQTWVDEYGMDLALITLAYERAVEIKGKLSFPYIGGILNNWHGKGIATTAQAMQEIREKPGGKLPKTPAQGSSSYDVEELERLITYGEI